MAEAGVRIGVSRLSSERLRMRRVVHVGRSRPGNHAADGREAGLHWLASTATQGPSKSRETVDETHLPVAHSRSISPAGRRAREVLLLLSFFSILTQNIL